MEKLTLDSPLSPDEELIHKQAEKIAELEKVVKAYKNTGMKTNLKQSFNKLGMFSFATFYVGEYKKEGMTYEKIFEKWKNSRVDFGDSLSITKLSSTPITPESLKAVGFKRINKYYLKLRITHCWVLDYFDEREEFELNVEYGDEDTLSKNVYFNSTEEITAFIKHFKK